MLSQFLQRYPRLWMLASRLYGLDNFNPNKVKFKRKSKVQYVCQFENTNYKLIFDGQCFQTKTHQRGIGQYSLHLLKTICTQRPDEKFAIFLTNLVHEKDLEFAVNILSELKAPNLDIVVIDVFGSSKKTSLIEAQERLRTSISKSYCNFIICLSPFENPLNSLPLPNRLGLLRIAILYDLIPIQFSKSLLTSRRLKSTYYWSLSNICEFDLLLSISNKTKVSWVDLAISDVPIELIYGANSDWSTLKNSDKDFYSRSGIISIGAEQPHKNIDRLIQSYSLLKSDVQKKHDLYILGIRSQGYKKRLTQLSKDCIGRVLILDYLSNEELETYLRRSRLLVMPSLAEGLSLPLLDAWANGLVTIGSRGSVAEEIIANEDLLFDPLSSVSISQQIQRYLENGNEWMDALDHCKERASDFSWEKTAKLTMSAIENLY